jgi:hypothetical protein
VVKHLFETLTRPWKSRRPPAIPDVSAAAEPELRARASQTVTFRGRLFLNGAQGPFVLVRGRPIYLSDYRDRAAAGTWRRDLRRLDGRSVRVVGVLSWMEPEPARAPGVGADAPPGHFFLDPGAGIEKLPRRRRP